MLTLCGFPISSYYNKTKLSLLEKGVPFQEELVMPSQKEELLKESAMGKVPFLRTEHGILTESQVIIEYIEDAYPQTPLYPKDPFERARMRELATHLELDVELPARRLYYEVFFGGKVSDETRKEVEEQVQRGLRSLARLVRFDPFIGGKALSHADSTAFIHLPQVGDATQKVFGRNLVEELLPAAAAYVKMFGERPHARKVSADRTAALAAFAAKK